MLQRSESARARARIPRLLPSLPGVLPRLTRRLNPFISRRRSLDSAETIRYTWNQLARSAGKWVKGLTARKSEREGKGQRGGASSCSLRNDSSAVARSILLFGRFLSARVSLSFSFPLLSASSPLLFLSRCVPTFPLSFPCPFPFVFSRAYGCLSPISHPLRLMEAHAEQRGRTRVREWSRGVSTRRETATKSR